MGGSVRRVVIEVERALRGEPRPIDEHEVGANPCALRDRPGTARAPPRGRAQPHYVADLVAGGALAGSVYALEPAFRPAIARLAAAWPAPGA